MAGCCCPARAAAARRTSLPPSSTACWSAASPRSSSSSPTCSTTCARPTSPTPRSPTTTSSSACATPPCSCSTTSARRRRPRGRRRSSSSSSTIASTRACPPSSTTNLLPEQIDDRLRTRLTDAGIARVYVLEAKRPSELRGLDVLDHPLIREMTFERFETRGAHLATDDRKRLENAYRQALSFAEHPGGWLLFMGPHGSGKTHLAAAIANYRRAARRDAELRRRARPARLPAPRLLSR